MDDTNKDLVLPKGSLILVTGTSGFIAGHIVNEALKIGYRVRGTVRSEDKAKWTQELFKSPDYETAIVPNMAVDGAFDEAVKGVDAIIHTASVMTRSPNPNEVIPDVVAGATNILKSAATEPSVKRFVFTSSSTAATLPKPGKKFQIDASTWNDEAVELAWKPPPYDPSRTFTVYAASKTQAERAVWKFVQENNPHFVVNAVNPNGNMGRILATTGPTGSWIPSVARGELPLHVPPREFESFCLSTFSLSLLQTRTPCLKISTREGKKKNK